MPKRFREEHVPIDQIHGDAPIYQPFLDAMVAHMRGENPGERRTVHAHRIGIPEGFEAPPEHVELVKAAFIELRRTREEQMQAMAVWEGADGSLLAYDDAAVIAVYHQLAPHAKVDVVIIGKDAPDALTEGDPR